MTKGHVLCEVKALEDGDGGGEFEAILSAATLDRDGEIIDAKAFEPLPDHIAIDIDHGMTVATTVGSGQPFYDGDVLKIKGRFSSIPRAQELRTLVKEGHIRKMSVTFMGAQRNQKDGVPHVEKAELLNAAFVPIPSNREAAVLVAKAFVPPEVGQAQAGMDYIKAAYGDAVAHQKWAAESSETLIALIDERISKALGAVTDRQPYTTPTDTAAPETPAPAGKSPVSVVTQARLTLARALLDL